MAVEPGAHLRMLVCGVVVEHGVDHPAGGNLALDRVEEANEFLMPMALHVAPDHRAFEDVQRGEQRGGAVALVVVGHGGAAALLQRQTGLGSIKRLNLRLFVDAEHHRMGGRRDVESDHVAELFREGGVQQSGDQSLTFTGPDSC